MTNKILYKKILIIFLSLLTIVSITIAAFSTLLLISINNTIENVKIPEVNIQADFEIRRGNLDYKWEN